MSDDSRWLKRRILDQTKEALAAHDGNVAKAAAALGVHFTTIYNRQKWKDEEDPWWLYTVSGIYTGARPSEVQFIEWPWIKWDEDVLIIPADAPGNKMLVERIVPLQPEYRAILVERFKVGATGYVHAPAVTKCDESLRYQAFTAYVGRCGLPVDGRGPHSLRHNHAAIALAMNKHPAHLMLHQGWDSPKVAHDYSRTATRFRRDVVGWGSDMNLRPAMGIEATEAVQTRKAH